MNKSTNTLTIDLPINIDVQEAKLMIFASLFGKGRLSSGKAAEYLGMTRIDFLEQVGNFGISVFAEDEDDLEKVLNISL